VSALGAPMVTILAALLLVMVGLWLLSLLRRDASLVDIYWGLGFAQIALLGCWLADGWSGRKVLLTLLTVAWGVRLGVYLLWRNWGQGEDFRYRAMRRTHGSRFAWVSLYLVFGLQAALMWFVSLPVQLAQRQPAPAHFTALDAAGVLLWAIGLACESIGDWQLARFKADPAHRDTVLDRGLWRYTRHPNYFGDACVWWGLYLIAAAAGVWWTILSPLLMTLLLLKVSGVPMLERTIVKRRPDYAAYIARTRAFVPWVPKPR